MDLLERAPLVGPGVRPALAVGLAVAALVWLSLHDTSIVGLRYFLTSLSALFSAAAVWAFTLSRRRPDRTRIRVAELPVRLVADEQGLHLVHERGARESIRWDAPHAVALWLDEDDSPRIFRVASERMRWTLVGAPGTGAPVALPPTVPIVRLGSHAAARSSEDALARRRAPWEVVLRPTGPGSLLEAICATRPIEEPSPLWRVPLDAEWDPTARWSLRLRPGAVSMDRAGDPVESIELEAPFDATASWIAAVVLPGEPARPLRRVELRQGDARIRFAFDPAVLTPGGPATTQALDDLPTTDQPRLVPTEWTPVVLDHLGLDPDL